MENHQLTNAAMQTRQLNAIDNTNFFELFLSLHRFPLSPLLPSV
jgi:hypothetical protein